jgi:hypothetical protein
MKPSVFRAYTESGVIILVALTITDARLTVNELFPDDKVRMIVHDNDWEDS